MLIKHWAKDVQVCGSFFLAYSIRYMTFGVNGCVSGCHLNHSSEHMLHFWQSCCLCLSNPPDNLCFHHHLLQSAGQHVNIEEEMMRNLIIISRRQHGWNGSENLMISLRTTLSEMCDHCWFCGEGKTYQNKFDQKALSMADVILGQMHCQISSSAGLA